MYEGNLAQRLDGETRDISSGSLSSGSLSSYTSSATKSVADVVRYAARRPETGSGLYQHVKEAVKQNIPLEENIPLSYDRVADALAVSLRQTVEDCCAEMKMPTYEYAMRHQATRYLEEGFEKHVGNVAGTARTSVGQAGKAAESERRQFYRILDKYPELKPVLNGYRPQKPDAKPDSKMISPLDKAVVETTLKGALAPYQSELHPERYQKIEASIGQNSQQIADALVQYMPTPEKRLDEFVANTYHLKGFRAKKQEFERQFLSYALERNDWDVKKTAEQLEMKERNLKRRINRLEIRPQEETIAEVIDLEERRKAMQAQKELTPLEAHIERARTIQKEQEQKHENAQQAKVISLEERRKKKERKPPRPAFENMYMIAETLAETSFGGALRDIQ